MFTGLIEEIGIIQNVSPIGGGKKIIISAKTVIENLKIDDSVAVNGTCQTVVANNNSNFTVEAIEETLLKTNLGSLRVGQKVNLERAMLPTTRFGGHFVQGHIDCVAKLVKIDKLTTAINLWFEYPEEYSHLVVPTGSITVQGISLTSARVEKNTFMTAIIPHTYANTTFKDLQIGNEVNIEFDVIGKYVANMLNIKEKHTDNKRKSSLDRFITQPDY